MTQLTSRISSEADLKAHIASYPELYEDLAVDALEDRLEMWCLINFCGCNDACGCDGACGCDDACVPYICEVNNTCGAHNSDPECPSDS